MYQVWNLLYNPNKASTYAKARQAAENIRNAKDKEKAIAENSELFISGMAGWATNSDYTDVIEDRRKTVIKTIEGVPVQK